MIVFDKKIEAVLAEYHQRMEKENAMMQSLPMAEGINRRDEFLLPVGKEVGQFLNMMVKAANAQTILEIGTSYGYSTVWLAEAARQTGGKVITLELDKRKANHAKSKIKAAGLEDFVDFRIGDALESIKETKETFDLVLIDIWKELYVPCFELVFPKLKKGAYLIADNIIFPAIHHKEAAIYRNTVKATKAFDTVLLPIGSGIEVSQIKVK
jgi:predicted O-methyltransferase YrrM